MTTPRKLKILMLHGFTQSGPVFHGKTRALEKFLSKYFTTTPQTLLPAYPGGIQLIYPTGPIALRPEDFPGFDGVEKSDEADTEHWGWWKGNLSDPHPVSMDAAWEVIATVCREQGPIDGVVGFSQGAAAAAMMASMLEPGREDAFARHHGIPFPASFHDLLHDLHHPPLKFAAVYCGFYAPHDMYKAFYDPPIHTPTLHVLGSLDSVVEEYRSTGLIEGCANKVVLHHPGGHFVPSSKNMCAALVNFIKESCQ